MFVILFSRKYYNNFVFMKICYFVFKQKFKIFHVNDYTSYFRNAVDFNINRVVIFFEKANINFEDYILYNLLSNYT
jgi:hypothetical protein